MVHADAGDDADDRIDHVRGVEPAAGADFDDGDVDVSLGEPVKRERGPDFRVAIGPIELGQ